MKLFYLKLFLKSVFNKDRDIDLMYDPKISESAKPIKLTIRFTEKEYQLLERQTQRFNNSVKTISEYCRDVLFLQNRKMELLKDQELEIRGLIDIYKKQEKNPAVLLKSKITSRITKKLIKLIESNFIKENYLSQLYYFDNFYDYYETKKRYIIIKLLKEKKDRVLFSYWYDTLIDEIASLYDSADQQWRKNLKNERYKKQERIYFDGQ